MSATKISSCTCKHDFQDARYGAGKRVFNVGGANSNVKWRCTACGKESVTSSPKK